ncbi:hypothetical protein TSAR_016821 [Trichomalopsis sarcophagae]|uniref:alpha-glucosidase n=1 Tax=Trichomalopsis sarcophagae TaxID=543379 RepID=A0A232FDF5_9HYME|nr:hypothetical protein TSAR_016821 [Trichomalopsis sarcophagae]
MEPKSGSKLDSDSAAEAATANTGNGSVAPTDLVQPTYKQLPDEDVNWQARNNAEEKKEPPNKAAMGKQNGTDPEHDDGAQERMLKDDVKLSVVPSKDASEVKFIPENGDAKIDIETVKQSLSGMGKAELMKYANDPFWIRLRWFLFVAFWVLWAAMLAGAIAIIVMAPKCSPPPPKKWWEESPIVRLDPSDSATKDLSGLEFYLDILKKQHVKAISLSSIIKETAPGHTEDYKDLSQKVGLFSDFTKFVGKAKANDQNIILELDPNHSSDQHPWFLKSVKKEEPYTSYYVWADGKVDPESRTLLPPNNWVSLNGGSAWKFNEERQQFYLHQFNESQPDLNYTNPAVVNEFSDILKHWLKLSVKGFRLANTRYLVEDPSLANDSHSSSYPAESGTYQSLLHIHTRDHPQNAVVLRKWRDVVSNYTNGDGLFALSDDTGPDVLQMYNQQKTLVDLPQSINFLANIDPTVTAAALNQSISTVLAFASWPGIDFNGKETSLRKRIHAEIADSLTLMTMLLPATPILKLNDTISAKDAFATLAETRKSKPFLYGDTKTYVLNNGTVFVYTRIKSGTPGYLVAYNSASQNTTMDLTSVKYVPEEVSVYARSPNYVENLDVLKKVISNNVPISPKSTLVVTFAPKKE